MLLYLRMNGYCVIWLDGARLPNSPTSGKITARSLSKSALSFQKNAIEKKINKY